MLALLDQVITLLQLPLPQAACHQRVAMGIHAIGEVCAGHAGPIACEADQLLLIHERPLLQGPTPQLVQIF